MKIKIVESIGENGSCTIQYIKQAFHYWPLLRYIWYLLMLTMKIDLVKILNILLL